MVRARAGAKLLDDGADDRVGRDRAGEALEDPGEALGLSPSALFQLLDGEPVTNRGEADDDDQARHRDVERHCSAREETHDGDRAEGEERAGEDEPRAADPWIFRSPGRTLLGRLSHVRT